MLHVNHMSFWVSPVQTGAEDHAEDPIDIYYKKLNTDVKPLEHGSDMFKLIARYVENTHAATHRQYDLEVRLQQN